MSKICLKYTYSAVFMVLASLSTQTLATDSLVRHIIESFEISGLSLNSSIEELEALTDSNFRCSIEEGLGVSDSNDVDYWTCRDGNTQLIISVYIDAITEIHFSSQSPANSFDQLRSDLAELNQRLLEEGHATTDRNAHEDDAFFYRHDDMPAMPTTEMVLKITSDCTEVDPGILALSAKVSTFAGSFDDVGMSVFRKTERQYPGEFC